MNGTLASELRTRFCPIAVDVLGHDGIVDDLRLALHFLRHLLAQRDFFLDRVEVDTLADIAIADLIGIFFLVRRRKPGDEGEGERRANSANAAVLCRQAAGCERSFIVRSVSF